VRNFLLASALFWLREYHFDGLRVDAVASMLYRDYSRKEGSWIPNVHGGRENFEAVSFLQALTTAVKEECPGCITVAEESTSWPGVSQPVESGGLGFTFKWNLGWMHDTLQYFGRNPIHRRHHQDQLTFAALYEHTEHFMMPLSHDEVVHGKGSLLARMPGDDWQRFANLRLLLGYMYGQPGKKLTFMGAELGQWSEWNHDASLDWHLLEYPAHQGIQRWVEDLNRLYREQPALHQIDFSIDGFAWVDCHDWEHSTLSFLRKGGDREDLILVLCNFTPVPRPNYRVGVPQGGYWRELLNSDAALYGGSGQGNLGGVEAAPLPAHGHYHSLSVSLPPLGVVFFKPESP
jgi:1,4-alpha-glucan branching enzyme